MCKLLSTVHRFCNDEEGAALVEYTVLLGVMLVAVIALIGTVGVWVSDKWQSLATALP